MTEKKSRLGFLVAGLLLGILISAMDNTIVATAMGTIVADLGGLDKFVWVTSAYMVAEMAGMPIFGKLSDMYGRKRFFLFGLVVFLLGSVLCGTAHSIVQLSIYRAIQGIGGGALMPIAFTIMFDVFPPEKRAKMGGLFGAVFGISSIFGPLLGAYITDHISWHWVFYINLPLGILAIFFVTVFYHETPMHTKQKIDWLGAITLVGAVVCLMFGLELGGNKYDWNSAPIISLFVAFVVLFIVFLVAETKAEEPILPFSLFKDRLFATSNIIGFLYGAAFIVATVYIPIFVQGVFGGTATNSGMILLPMMLGVVVSAQVGAFSSMKLSFRTVMSFSVIIFLVAAYLLSTLTVNTSHTTVTIFMIIVGLGVGMSFSVLSIACINDLEAHHRGTANSTMSFLRELGMTIGISVYGIIQRDDFTQKLKDAFAGMGGGAASGQLTSDPHALLSPQLRAHIPGPILDKITVALSSSIAHTFLWGTIPVVLAIFAVAMMGKGRLTKAENEEQPVAQAVQN